MAEAHIPLAAVVLGTAGTAEAAIAAEGGGGGAEVDASVVRHGEGVRVVVVDVVARTRGDAVMAFRQFTVRLIINTRTIFW